MKRKNNSGGVPSPRVWGDGEGEGAPDPVAMWKMIVGASAKGESRRHRSGDLIEYATCFRESQTIDNAPASCKLRVREKSRFRFFFATHGTERFNEYAFWTFCFFCCLVCLVRFAGVLVSSAARLAPSWCSASYFYFF